MSKITDLPFFNLCPYAVSTMADDMEDTVGTIYVAPSEKPVQVVSISIPAILGEKGRDIPFSTLKVTQVSNLPAAAEGRFLIVPKMVQIILKDLGRTKDIVSSYTFRHCGNVLPSLVTKFDESAQVPAKVSEGSGEGERKLEAEEGESVGEGESKLEAEEGESAAEGELVHREMVSAQLKGQVRKSWKEQNDSLRKELESVPQFINLTGEDLYIGEDDYKEQPDGFSKGAKVATVAEKTHPYLQDVQSESFKYIRICHRTVDVENLPAPAKGRILIVSERIFRMFPDRQDLVFPDPNSLETAFDGTRVCRSLINKIEYSEEVRAAFAKAPKKAIIEQPIKQESSKSSSKSGVYLNTRSRKRKADHEQSHADPKKSKSNN